MIRSGKISLSVIFFCSLISVTGFAQKTTGSPYSLHGLGDPATQGLAPQISMGNTGYATVMPYTLNLFNPASYSSILTPTFDVGVSSDFLSVYGASNGTQNHTYLRNIAFGFPIAKTKRTRKNWWGASFGLVPVTKMGYKINTSETTLDLGTINTEYEGKGNISKFFIGNAFTPFQDSIQQLSLGFNAYYLFGSLQKTRKVVPQDGSAFNVLTGSILSVGDIGFDFGILYHRKIGKVKFSTGGAYTYGNSINATFNQFAATYTGTTQLTIKDTITDLTDTGTVFLPSKIGAGFALEIGEKWLLAADYETRDWSRLVIFNQNQNLTAANQISFGMQYTPDKKAVTNFWKTNAYRAGARLAETRLQPDEKSLNEYGITFGVGVPLLKSQSRSNFNFAMEVGQRGNTGEDAIKEQFVNFIVGFSFTPHKFDRWFHKQKFD